MESLAWIVVRAIEVYAVVGAIFAVLFVSLGIGRVDRAAASAGWGFRALVAPGCAALWPVLLTRWIRGRNPPEERNAHRVRARSGAR